MANGGIATNPSVRPLFDTAHLKADLKGRSVRGGAATMLGQGAKFVIHTGSTMILARLLTPKDFGLIAMVTALTNLANVFKDLGLSMATVQKAEITHAQISVLFWVNVGVSALIALLTMASAPVIAWFYGEPRLVGITLALSLTFLLGGLTVQHQALLQRQMWFKALAVIPVLSITTGVLSAVATAILGGGYWALVVMQLTMPLTNMLGVWTVCRWRPGLPRRQTGVRGMLGFGANLTGFNTLNYLIRNVDHVLIGKVWGAQPLGLYSKAYGLLMLPISQVTAPIAAVAVPTLSRLQDDADAYRRHYYRAVNAIAFMTIPVILLVAALSREVITFFLGARWIEAANIFEVLSFAAVFQPVGSTVGWVYVSLGQTDRMFRWGLIVAPIILFSFAIGLPWGALGVATSYTIVYVVGCLVPGFWFAYRQSPLSVRGLLHSISCPVVLGFVGYCTVHILRHLWAIDTTYVALPCLSVSGLLSSGFVMLIWPKARREFIGLCALGQLLRRGRDDCNDQ